MRLFTSIKNQWILVHTSWTALSKNRIVSLATKLSFVLCLGSILCIVLVWNRLPPIVPLWYSKPWGLERLTNPLWLFLLPSSALIITGINIYIASILTSEYLVFSQTLSLSSLVISALSTITLLKSIFIVI